VARAPVAVLRALGGDEIEPNEAPFIGALGELGLKVEAVLKGDAIACLVVKRREAAGRGRVEAPPRQRNVVGIVTKLPLLSLGITNTSGSTRASLTLSIGPCGPAAPALFGGVLPLA